MPRQTRAEKAEYVRQWRLENPGYDRQWRLENPEYYPQWELKNRAKRAEQGRQWELKNLDKRRAWNRQRRLKKSGWTMETFANAKEAQGGCCAICGDTPIPAAHCSEGLCADHKHVMPPMPRALLCLNCNSGIGYFLDSPERCEAAAKYLRHWENMDCSEIAAWMSKL